MAIIFLSIIYGQTQVKNLTRPTIFPLVNFVKLWRKFCTAESYHPEKNNSIDEEIV